MGFSSDVFGLPYLSIKLFYIGVPVVQADGRTGGRAVGRSWSLLFAVRPYTVPTASKEVTMFTSTHNLPLSSYYEKFFILGQRRSLRALAGIT